MTSAQGNSVSNLIYEEIPHIDRSGIEAAIGRDDPSELRIAVLSAAMYMEDRDFAYEVCLRLAKHPNSNVRGNAILGFGHIARIDEWLDEGTVRPLILNALQDEDKDVRVQAAGARDDIEWYLGWKV